MAAKSKVIKQVTGLYMTVDKTGTFGTTTLTAAAAAGAGTITVSSITNFAVGDIIRIGSGETFELARVHGSTAPSGSTITLESVLMLAHPSGDAVVEQEALDLGAVGDEGVTVNYEAETETVGVATKRLPFTVLNGYVDASMEFSLPTVSLYSIATAIGALRSKVTGAGTAADPLQMITDGNEFGGMSDSALIVVGVQMDGSIIRAELWSVDFDYTGISFSLSRGALASIPVRAVGSGGMFASSAQTWTPLTTYTPTKAKVFDYITEVGYFTAGGTGASTVASGGAAGTNTVTLVSATGYGANDWVKFGTGDTAEIHQIESVATNTLTLRTRFLRAQAASTVCAEQVKVPFEGLSEEGATLAFGGSVENLRIATSRVSIGVRPGNVDMTLSFKLINITLEVIAQALGVPASAIVSGRLPLRNNVATTTIDGLYFTGVEQGGNTFYGVVTGCSIDVSGFALAFNNSGTPSSVPLSVKPSSALTLVSTP